MLRKSTQDEGQVMERSVASLVDMRDVSLTCGNRCIFDNVSPTVPRGKITATMEPSGIGKTTLFRLIGEQTAPDHGEILSSDENIPTMSRSRLYTMCKRMSVLFRSGTLFADMNVFGSAAYPLCEHTRLPVPLLHNTVVVKLEAMGLYGTAKLVPSEFSGRMTWYAVLVCVTALEPDLIMSGEPFVGQNPITMGILVKLISELNSTLGMTRVVASHDMLEVLSIVDHAWTLADKKTVVHDSVQTL